MVGMLQKWLKKNGREIVFWAVYLGVIGAIFANAPQLTFGSTTLGRVGDMLVVAGLGVWGRSFVLR